MTENTRTRSHQLIGAGAAHDEDGDRLFSNTTSGTGRALCSCGWLSDPVEFGRQRKTLHKAHAEQQKAPEAPVLDEVFNPMESFSDLAPGADDDLLTILDEDAPADVDGPWELEDELEPEPETEPEPEGVADADEVSLSGPFAVVWPEGVARLFWRALAKDGAAILAEAHGLTRKSNESKGELLIVGPPNMAAYTLAEQMTDIFTAAEASLKQWRKTSPNYKQHGLKTADGRRDAFQAEQDYLRGFCWAVAGTFTQDMLASDGVQAGIDFVNAEDLL